MPRAPRKVTLRMTVATAVRTRKCKRNSAHKISSGQTLLLVKDAGPAGGEKSYCRPCASEMLATAHDNLQELARQLRVGDEN